MQGLTRNARLVWRVWVFTLRSFLGSEFFILTAVMQPVIFASIAFFLFQAGGDAAGEQTLLYAALGTGMMGVWSTTLFGCGGAKQFMAGSDGTDAFGTSASEYYELGSTAF